MNIVVCCFLVDVPESLTVWGLLLLWVEQCPCPTFHHTKSLPTVTAKILLSGEKTCHDSPNLNRIGLSASILLQLDHLLGAPCRPFFNHLLGAPCCWPFFNHILGAPCQLFFKILRCQTHKFLQIFEGFSARGWTRFLSWGHGLCEILHCFFTEGDWFPLPLGSPRLGLKPLPAVAYQSTMWTYSLQL